MIVLIDNYDSFTYNLYQLLGEHKEEIVVVRNDEITIEQLEEMNPRGIVLSPGPGKPEDAGICIDV
ncbi:glutamine amidotransferase-related protein, partial [Bacillus cereus]